MDKGRKGTLGMWPLCPGRESFDDKGINLNIHQYINVHRLVFTAPPPKFLVTCSAWLCYISEDERLRLFSWVVSSQAFRQSLLRWDRSVQDVLNEVVEVHSLGLGNV